MHWASYRCIFFWKSAHRLDTMPLNPSGKHGILNEKDCEVYVMKLMVFILNKVDALELFLCRLAEEGIRGATIVSSTGMAKALFDFGDESFFGSLRAILDPTHEENKTILMVVEESQIQTILQVIDEVVGDLSKPDTGIVFTLPIDMVKGMGK